METAIIYLIILGAIAGLSNGAGVLPDGPLNASVGGTVLFRTDLNPTETPFDLINWQFDLDSVVKTIVISQSSGNIIYPEYEGRITLFRSTASLELRNLSLSDSGYYRVTIQQGLIQHLGNSKLEIYEPVSNARVSPPSADLIEFNSSVHLLCSSSGSSLSFLWMKDGSEITASDRVQITNGGSNLTIVNVTRYDQGSYSCRVSNPVSSKISDPVSITVSYGPDSARIEVYPSKEHHKKGSDINLICSADSSPSAEIQWFLNEDLLPDIDPLLQLMNAQLSQSGNYSCQAFNSKTQRYQTSQPSAVYVHEPVFNVKVIQEITQLVEFTKSISFFCSSTGSSLSFLWMKDSSEITVTDRVQITDGGSNLTIVNVTRYDQGSYSCHVSNPVSSASSDQVHLSVSYGPEKIKLRISPSQKHYKEGSNIHLSCLADSQPTAIFHWFLNGTVLPGPGSEFKLISVQINQSGTYSCQAFNNRTLIYQTSQPSVISIVEAGGLSDGAIAGIVIACLVATALGAAGGFFIYKRIKNVKAQSKSGKTEQEHVYENMPELYDRKI